MYSHVADLQGITPALGQHHIDLMNSFAPGRPRQYRLNLKYSLMVKKCNDSLLKVGFIYPMCNSEWVSVIDVVPKKVGADRKVKIQVCQYFQNLNVVAKKWLFSSTLYGYHLGPCLRT